MGEEDDTYRDAVLVSRSSLSFASLSCRLYDELMSGQDGERGLFIGGSRFTSVIGPNQLVIFKDDAMVPGYLDVQVLDGRSASVGALNGRLTLPSGRLWIDDVGLGTEPVGASVAAGSYRVHVAYPSKHVVDERRYVVTLFDHRPTGLSYASSPG